ncbi:hypothetical protein Poly41_62300 [Novipirellula artificiosorum]|uniref:Uncharacterized protein n=1 Tax=Novipirellula artificiosorum TaxID=2528016 RepID=A0A5C6D6N7_9BACT|nr:hypothetical protein Poly41_62300 [Novipirellula artificiosorum]
MSRIQSERSFHPILAAVFRVMIAGFPRPEKQVFARNSSDWASERACYKAAATPSNRAGPGRMMTNQDFRNKLSHHVLPGIGYPSPTLCIEPEEEIPERSLSNVAARRAAEPNESNYQDDRLLESFLFGTPRRKNAHDRTQSTRSIIDLWLQTLQLRNRNASLTRA